MRSEKQIYTIENVKKWWPIALLLLLGGILSASSNILELIRNILPTPSFHGKICNITEDGCAHSNKKFVEFLHEHQGSTVKINVEFKWYQKESELGKSALCRKEYLRTQGNRIKIGLSTSQHMDACIIASHIFLDENSLVATRITDAETTAFAGYEVYPDLYSIIGIYEINLLSRSKEERIIAYLSKVN
ncbi:hypothetical protein [Pararhizobium sp. IMCC21322]|uniref:hypothetical protein n=1 Tax=Pararhizobium sp. IMCC21322 TaxID=3067903 RepID=UPI002740D37D|nr:hypothetical protein [Pararhizobium sp. IMCC21322]